MELISNVFWFKAVFLTKSNFFKGCLRRYRDQQKVSKFHSRFVSGPTFGRNYKKIRL